MGDDVRFYVPNSRQGVMTFREYREWCKQQNKSQRGEHPASMRLLAAIIPRRSEPSPS